MALVRLIADGVPRLGVVIAQFVARQIPPDPETEAARAVPTPVPKLAIPDIGKPLPFVRVTDEGVPKLGVVIAQLVVKHMLPEPDTFAAKADPTPVPSPVIPAIGNPVPFVSVILAGVCIANPVGRVVEIDPTPPELVTSTPLFAVASQP